MWPTISDAERWRELSLETNLWSQLTFASHSFRAVGELVAKNLDSCGLSREMTVRLISSVYTVSCDHSCRSVTRLAKCFEESLL